MKYPGCYYACGVSLPAGRVERGSTKRGWRRRCALWLLLVVLRAASWVELKARRVAREMESLVWGVDV